MLLTLCPRCRQPIEGDPCDDFGSSCSRCGQDTSGDEGIVMDARDFATAPRKECLYCGTLLLLEAKACPECQAEVPD